MQRASHLLHSRLLEPFFQDRQSFVQCHPGLKQMGELLGKNEELIVRDFQVLRLWERSGSRFFLASTYWPRAHHFDPNRNATLLLDLVNGDRTIGAVQNSLDQFALGVTRAIGKLWHRTGN